jgi:Transposase DDE domain
VTSLPRVAAALQHVLTAVPAALARESGFCQRRSKLTAACFVQATVLGWLAHPQATLTQLSQRAAARGVAISPQGVDRRFTPAAADLLRGVWEAALAEVVVAEPLAAGLLAKFPAAVLLDSTTIALPDGLASVWIGCGGRVEQGGRSALELGVALDLVEGRLAIEPGDGRAQDKTCPLQHAPLPEGALRVTDLGFWSLAVLREIADQGAYFLSRLHLQTAVFAADGERLDLVAWLGQQKRNRLSVAVRLGVAARVGARLLAVRVPHRVAEARREKIRAEAKRDGVTPSAIKLALAAWTLLVTNAPPAVLALREALVLARARWQIELLFKLWKDGGRIDEWRSANADRILCEVYAKLTAMVIQHWVLLVTCWAFADRSLTQAARTVRDYAVTLLIALPSRRGLLAVLAAIGAGLAGGGRIASRRKRPSLFQLLTDPTLGGLA